MSETAPVGAIDPSVPPSGAGCAPCGHPVGHRVVQSFQPPRVPAARRDQLH
ncbi:MAG TPA: hypothetical protein VES93_02640 [Ornithinibacter sp.]|nr:hypothetical protein [Ornithinibacter sp.]